ncbi:MAG: GNAT family N-acetyltransferase [Crenarchaeota archaeon]|nr:GNAT family N-acetyltransferase [Thermoproteota archaeon]MCR8453447.1 GNAT family N-acetyltransferase [Thermoproteota archaeon]MCR8454908.1 GNAT family N-acetyltransferase [Thermoproteota archaeon]MCR8462794.1 GNAT family N-acetyltransferase [Thermoproteota archaeon]MCR8470511.1 GNAT family N-acetyltransferase [Thermoproteota archaeon]
MASTSEFKFNLDGIKIRRCSIEDIAGVISVNRRTLPENYSTSLFLAMLRNFGSIFFVAVDLQNDEVIGYCMNKLEFDAKSFFERNRKVTKGHVFSIGVLPDYRRRGIASALMVVSMRHMFKLNASEVFLEVRVSNIPAQNLYHKLGFEVVARVANYYADGEDAYVMAIPRSKVDSLVEELYLRLKKINALEIYEDL